MLWLASTSLCIQPCPIFAEESLRLGLERKENAVSIIYDGQEGVYYQLLTAHSLTDPVWSVANMQLGEARRKEWEQPSPSGETSVCFYKLLQIPQNQPRDADEDGMDDVFELNTPGLNPLEQGDAEMDFDGDGLCNGEEYRHSMNILTADSDNDGIDDGFMMRSGLTVLLRQDGELINPNWLYHGGFEQEPFTEYLPGLPERFASINLASETCRTYILAPHPLLKNPENNASVNLLVHYTDPNSGEYMTSLTYPAQFYTNLALSESTPFHGLPTMGSATLDVYSVDWPLPQVSQLTEIRYAPFVEANDGAEASERLYLICPYSGNVSMDALPNNWLFQQQYLEANPSIPYFFLTPAFRIENSGFEEISDDPCLIPSWIYWYENNGITFLQNETSDEGEQALCMTTSGSGLYQDIGILPGSELVVQARIFPYRDNNENSEEPFASISIEYSNTKGTQISSDRFTFQGPDMFNQWNTVCITSRVPDYARTARTMLFREGCEENVKVFFDSVSVRQNADSDGDGMPDWWELQNGFDPNLKNDALNDADGDGLENIYEYHNYTDPANSDSDQDGISDGDEVKGSLNPNDPLDADQDSDNDGLSNREELNLGTDLSSVDTDNDGLSDWMETNLFDTDPLTPDSENIIDTVQSFDCANTTAQKGGWIVDETSVFSTGIRGELSYMITPEEADIYLLRITGSDHFAYIGNNEFPLKIYLDDHYLEETTLVTTDGESGITHMLTPWITPGEHEVRILWDNLRGYRSLRMQELELCRINGEDSDGDGRKDWISGNMERIAALEKAPFYTVVSPVCIEGRARFPEMIQIDENTPAARLPGNRWYANVHLPTYGEVETHTVSYQNGARNETVEIQWVPFNLFNAPEEEHMMLRTGDTIMLTMHPEGVASGYSEIHVDGDTIHTGDPLGRNSYQLFTPGTHQICAYFQPDEGETSYTTIYVEVYERNWFFPESPVCAVGHERDWVVTVPSDQIILEAENCATLLEDSYGNWYHYSINLPDTEPRCIAARLGPDGAVLATEELRSLRFASANHTGMYLVETLEGGDQVIEMPIVSSPVQPDVEFTYDLLVAGVTFDDATISKTLTADDFNEVGEHLLRFIRNPDAESGACHSTTVYQNGQRVAGY
ncbi:MAG: hypothetical protein PHP44_00305 [Kiritimatiellae bacterium]|nr:hypothetical protein [Kiritimatiellia bacterium]